MNKEQILERLDYDELTGKFFWKNPASNRVKKGSEASTTDSCGYLRIGIDGKRWYAHRLAAILLWGELSDTDRVDHINHNRSDNRPQNLRIASALENNRNKSAAPKYGVYGVYPRKGKWYAEIGSSNQGTYQSLGTYENQFDAFCARKSAEARLNYHENHGKKVGAHV